MEPNREQREDRAVDEKEVKQREWKGMGVRGGERGGTEGSLVRD